MRWIDARNIPALFHGVLSRFSQTKIQLRIFACDLYSSVTCGLFHKLFSNTIFQSLLQVMDEEKMDSVTLEVVLFVVSSSL